MSADTPRTPARPVVQPHSPPALATKSSTNSSSTSSTSSTASTPLSSPPTSQDSSPSPVSSPSPCLKPVSTLTARLSTVGVPGFVSARRVYEEQQGAPMSTSPSASASQVDQQAVVAMTTPGPPPATTVTGLDPSSPRVVAHPSSSSGAAGSTSATSSDMQLTTPATQSGVSATSATTAPTLAMHNTGERATLPSHFAVQEPRNPQVAVAAVGDQETNVVVLRDTAVFMPEEGDRARGGSAMPSPTSWVAKLTVKLEYARVAAAVLEFYLAMGISLQDLTTWYRNGRGSIRVATAAAIAAQEAQAAHAADPVGVPAPAPPGAAKMYLFGQILDEQFYLRSDGNYRGENNLLGFNRSFAGTTLTCALGPPPEEYPTLNADYQAGLGTLVGLLPANATVKSGHVYEKLARKHIRLRHAVFAPRTDTDDTASIENVPAEFTVQGWKTYSDVADQARAAIEETHVARPLPAYDLLGNLIAPANYGDELRRATVLVGFSMTHYDIAERRANGTQHMKCTMCLDIQYLRVVIPPAKFTGNKRNNIHLNDPVSHAAKKQRA